MATSTISCHKHLWSLDSRSHLLKTRISGCWHQKNYCQTILISPSNLTLERKGQESSEANQTKYSSRAKMIRVTNKSKRTFGKFSHSRVMRIRSTIRLSRHWARISYKRSSRRTDGTRTMERGRTAASNPKASTKASRSSQETSSNHQKISPWATIVPAWPITRMRADFRLLADLVASRVNPAAQDGVKRNRYSRLTVPSPTKVKTSNP